jgi:hypothetical protein
MALKTEPESEEAAVFHPPGDGHDYATIELAGTRVGLYRDDGIVVVRIHPPDGGNGQQPVAVHVDDAVVRTPAEPRGRHRKGGDGSLAGM